jgi:hypothetical protein
MRVGRYLILAGLILVVLGSNIQFQVSAQSGTSNTFALQGWQDSPYTCWYWWADFSLSGGEEGRVQWSTSSQIPTAVDLYVVTPEMARVKWFCGTGPETLYYVSSAFGSKTWAAPSTGSYVIILVNNNRNTLSGTLSIFAGNATIPFSATGYGIAWQDRSVCLFNCSNA